MLKLPVQGSYLGTCWYLLVPCPGMPLSYTIFPWSDSVFTAQSSRSQMEGISFLHLLPNALFLPLLSLLHTSIKVRYKCLETLSYFRTTSCPHVCSLEICARGTFVRRWWMNANHLEISSSTMFLYFFLMAWHFPFQCVFISQCILWVIFLFKILKTILSTLFRKINYTTELLVSKIR